MGWGSDRLGNEGWGGGGMREGGGGDVRRRGGIRVGVGSVLPK